MMAAGSKAVSLMLIDPDFRPLDRLSQTLYPMVDLGSRPSAWPVLYIRG